MFRVLLALALALGVSSCSWFQGDEEGLEVSNEANAAEGNAMEGGNNFANQELGLGQEEGMGNDGTSFNNQISGENSSVAEDNPLLNNEDTMAGGDAPVDMSAGMGMTSEGAVVRYTIGDTNVYAQPDASSAPLRTLAQGEVLLVTISGEFAQSAFGYVAVSNLSAELQSRVFMGNDWQ